MRMVGKSSGLLFRESLESSSRVWSEILRRSYCWALEGLLARLWWWSVSFAGCPTFRDPIHWLIEALIFIWLTKGMTMSGVPQDNPMRFGLRLSVIPSRWEVEFKLMTGMPIGLRVCWSCKMICRMLMWMYLRNAEPPHINKSHFWKRLWNGNRK